AFVRIHPFADGNGRVARALASVFTYRRPGVPLVVFADQKDIYLDALEAADSGRPEAFVNFVGERCLDTIELVRSSLGITGAAATAARALADLTVRDDLTRQDHNKLHARIMSIVRERFPTLFAELDLGDSVRFGHEVQPPELRPPDGQHPVGATIRGHSLGMWIPLAGAANSLEFKRHGSVAIWSAARDTAGADFVATTSASPELRLEVFVRDIHPVETEVLRIKIDNWIRAILDIELPAFDEHVRAVMSTMGDT
ncbi:MAG: Fic family protein, partial [Dermatophilaceae bacterium]